MENSIFECKTLSPFKLNCTIKYQTLRGELILKNKMFMGTALYNQICNIFLHPKQN